MSDLCREMVVSDRLTIYRCFQSNHILFTLSGAGYAYVKLFVAKLVIRLSF